MSQRSSLDAGKHLVKTEAEVDTVAWKRSAAADHAMRLFESKVFSHLGGLLGNSSLYRLDYKKTVDGKAVRQLGFTTPPLFCASALLSDEIVQLLQIEARVEEHPSKIVERRREQADPLSDSGRVGVQRGRSLLARVRS